MQHAGADADIAEELLEVAVLIDCEHVFDWLEIQETVVQAVIRIRQGRHLPTSLVCPIFNGRPEPLLAQEIISTAHNAPSRKLAAAADHTSPVTATGIPYTCMVTVPATRADTAPTSARAAP